MEPEGGEYWHTWRTIGAWVRKCIECHCFCPREKDKVLDYMYNVSPYISSPGAESGAVLEGRPSVFRVAPDAKGNKEVHQRVAHRMAKVHGKDLFHFCHMGKEESVYAHALMSCMTTFRPDLRLLLDNCPIYDSARHIRALGLEGVLPGLCAEPVESSGPVECDAYVKEYSCRGNGGIPISDGLGINIWGALVMASFIESADLHPKGSSDFARNVLAQILAHAPLCATPGNMIPVRSFHVNSGKPQHIVVRSHVPRPEHFLCPIMDENFAITGELTYCRAKYGLLPEDMMHCANLMGTASFLQCEFSEVTPAMLRGSYQLVPNRWYPILCTAPATSIQASMRDIDPSVPLIEYAPRGSIRATNAGVVYRISDPCEGDEEYTWGSWIAEHTHWEIDLHRHGCIVLPLISRPCAAVWVDDARSVVGLIVPAISPVAGENTCVNFMDDGWTYLVRIGPEETALVDPLTILHTVIPVGTVVLIKPLTPAWNSLRSKMPSNLKGEAGVNHAIRARIAVPASATPDKYKLFVTYLMNPRAGVGALVPGTIAVDPWELLPEKGSGYDVVKKLIQ